MEITEQNVEKEWRGGVYLCTTKSSFEADILESKLRSENIPSIKRYRGASNFLEIAMGSNIMHPIDIYVPKALLADAKNVIIAVPLDDDFDEEFDGEFDEEFDGEFDEEFDGEFDDEDFDDDDFDD